MKQVRLYAQVDQGLTARCPCGWEYEWIKGQAMLDEIVQTVGDHDMDCEYVSGDSSVRSETEGD